jgi:hypothetical protein
MGGREAWDHTAYWQIGYPLLGLLAGLGGYFGHEKPWLWPLLLVAGQFAVLFFANPTGSLLPLGVIFMLFTAAPMMIPAYIGAVIERRSLRRPRGT